MLFESLSILCVYNNSRISFYTLILAFRFLHRSHFVLPIIFGMGYMNLASKFNEILEKDPRLDDDGQVMRFGNGY